MMKLTTEEKYTQQVVVEYWKKLSQDGLQKCEQEMVRRYFPPKGYLLDLGCGAGRAVFALNQAGYRVTGLDLSLRMLAAGRGLSATAAFSGANIAALPFVDQAFDGAFMFFGALQHIPGQVQRRQTLKEVARITQAQGQLILGLDNLAPALACYLFWLGRKVFAAPSPLKSTQAVAQTTLSDADATLWDRKTRQVHPLIWHMRGLGRTLRWRTWPGIVDLARQFSPITNEYEVGDVQVGQFSVPPTPGRIYYHIYRPDELIEDAASAGWHLLGHHSGAELTEGRDYPPAIRQRDKQQFFAFQRQV